jgi:hypothetical protein
MDFCGFVLSFSDWLAKIAPLIVVFTYEVFTGAVRPQFELFSNIALWLGKLIHVTTVVDTYFGDRNLNVKIENKPFCILFRRPIPCRAQMRICPIKNGVKASTGDRFDVAPVGKGKGEKFDLDVGIENTIQLLRSSYSGVGEERMCVVPPNGSYFDSGDVEIELILSWGMGSKSYRIGRYHLPDLAPL